MPEHRPTSALAIVAIAASLLQIPISASAASAAPAAPAASTPTASALSAARVAATPTRRGMGAVPTSARIAATPRKHTGPLALAYAFPASVDLTSWTLPPGDQGQVGSCTSWSIGYSIGGWYATKFKQYGAPFAPMYLYSQVHGPTGDTGSSTSANYNVLESQGIAEKSVYTQGDFNWQTKPTAAEIANAALHKGVGHTYLFGGQNQGQAGADAIRGALASGSPVELAIPVYSPFFGLNSSDSVMTAAKATGTVAGWHAIAAFGYNETGVVIENSWSSGWGKAGFATLAWDFVAKYVGEASTISGLVGASQPPAVTAMSANATSSAGGSSLTITGLGFSTVDASNPAAVTLVNPANSAWTTNAPIISRTSTTLTVRVPALPSGASSTGWRVVVQNPVGASADVDADNLTYIAPTGAAFTDTYAPATGQAKIVVEGLAFGASATEFATLGITGKVNGVLVKLAWVSPTKVSFALPAGQPGTTASLVLTRGGVDGPAATISYAANISAVTWATEAATGALTGTVTGSGFLGSSAWTVTGPDGTALTVPAVAAKTDLAAAASGVAITSATAATVKLPANPGGPAGVWALKFTPDSSVRATAFLATAVAKATYAVPAITKLSIPASSYLGGTAITITGTSLGSLTPGTSGAVTVTTSDGTARNATLVSRTSTSAVVTMPAGPLGGATVRVSSPLGTSAVTAASSLTYLSPMSATFTLAAAPGSGLAKVTLDGTGFGTTATEFSALKLTAAINGITVPLTWVSSTRLSTSLPSGKPGADARLVLFRSGVPGTPDTLTYTAAVASGTWTTDAVSGARYGSLVGAGFTASTGWTITGPNGTVLALPVYATRTALNLATIGVVITGEKAATVKLPANPGGPGGTWRFAFTPDATTYPGAAFAATEGAVAVYAAPVITRLSALAASTGGGTQLTVTGTNFATLGAVSPAVTITDATGTTRVATLVSHTTTSAVIALPAATAGKWTVHLTSPFGTSVDALAAALTYVTPVSATFGISTAPSTGISPVQVTTGYTAASAAEYALLGITGKVNNVLVRLTWVSPTKLSFTLPAGTAGTTAGLVLYRMGVAGSSSSVTYVTGAAARRR